MMQSFSDDVLAEVRLSSVSGVGPLLRARLVEAFESAVGVLSTSAAELRSVRGIGEAVARAITSAPTDEATAAMLENAASAGIRVLTLADAEYPPGLRQIHDPPPVLYCRGEILPRDRHAVAIVGTRRATRYGLRQTEAFARGLAEAGVTIVSGLARGVDGVAHRTAVEAGGRTLAAMAGGLLRIYPPEHAELASRVAESGALLAEAPPPMPPMSGSFPQRNRIISGLSLGVLVIEAAERSGALITARHAAEQGRDAFALPGPVESPVSRGCHRLIQEGGKLVMSVEDVLDELEGLAELGPDVATRPKAKSAVTSARPVPAVRHAFDEVTQAVLDGVGRKPTSVDQLVDVTGQPVESVLAGISRLETAGAVRRVSGVLVCLP